MGGRLAPLAPNVRHNAHDGVMTTTFSRPCDGARTVLGLDLGQKSFGFTLVEFDAHGTLTGILRSTTILHSGNTEDGKTPKSYKAQGGEARRSRNRTRHSRARRKELGGALRAAGLPAPNGNRSKRAARIVAGDLWDVRNSLTQEHWLDDERGVLLSAAALHLLNRRGQRNAFSSLTFVRESARHWTPSPPLQRAYQRGEGQAPGSSGGGTATPAQLLCAVREALHHNGTHHVSSKALPVPLRVKIRDHEEAAEKYPDSLERWENSDKSKERPAEPNLDANIEAAIDTARKNSPEAAAKLSRQLDTHLFTSSLHRCDVLAEWYLIAAAQGLPEQDAVRIGDVIAGQGDPRTAARGNVGPDDLPRLPGQPEERLRAAKSSPVFQHHRIVATVMNLRTGSPKNKVPLIPEQRDRVIALLMDPRTTDPTWDEVAAAAGVTWMNTGDQTKVPTDTTGRALATARKDVPALAEFLDRDCVKANSFLIEVLVGRLSGTLEFDCADSDHATVQDWLDALSDEDSVEILDKVTFESGRAEHCQDNLRRLTEHMLEHDVDRHGARTAVFGTAEDWSPKPDPLGTRVGNPVVDANIDLVEKVFCDVVREFGLPDAVVIETTRDLANSVDEAGRIHRRNTARGEKRRAAVAEESPEERLTKFVFDRSLLLIEQDFTCLYCGVGIDINDMNVDHIVPVTRGGRSSRMNRAATCAPCNNAKGNRTLPEWAAAGGPALDSIIKRAKKVAPRGVDSVSTWRQKYVAALKAGEVERPIESFGWAATEIARQLKGVLGGDKVHLVSGRMTADARRMGKIDTDTVNKDGSSNRLLVRWPEELVTEEDDPMPKGAKSRLDRRHHAIDAAVVALLHDGVARQVFSERNLLEQADFVTGEIHAAKGENRRARWEDHVGFGENAARFAQLRDNLKIARGLLAEAVAADAIPVSRVRRFTVSTAAIHEETVRSFSAELGDALTVAQIHRIGDPALRRALLRHNDFETKAGLRHDPQRTVTIGGRTYFSSHRVGPVLLGDALAPNVIGRAANRGLWTALTRLPDYDPKRGLPMNPDRVIMVKSVIHTAKDPIPLFGKNGGALAVRGGWAIASTIHHTRLYRTDTGVVPVMVPTVDALELRKSGTSAGEFASVFGSPLAPHMFAVRQDRKGQAQIACDPDARFQVLLSGDAIRIDRERAIAMGGSFRLLAAIVPGDVHLTVASFESDGRVKMSPALLASEGAPAKRWIAALGNLRVTASKLTGAAVIRRSVTGHIRKFGDGPLDSYVIGQW